MELVRSRLCRNMEDLDSSGSSNSRNKRSRKSKGVGRKRRRVSNENFLMAAAMEDLYNGVASAAASATAAAAGVLCDEPEHIRVVDGHDDDHDHDDAGQEAEEDGFGPVSLLI